MVLIPEGFALGMYGHQAEHRSVQRVDPLERGGAGMGRFSFVINQLCRKPGAHGGSTGLKPRFHNGTVLHDADVDIIEFTKPDKLLFPAQEPLFSFFPALVPICNLNKFLRRNAHQNDVTVQVFHKIGIVKRIGNGRNGSQLGIVAACVNRSGHFVRIGMIRHKDCVQLPHDRNPDAGLFSPICVHHAGTCNTGSRFSSESLQN